MKNNQIRDFIISYLINHISKNDVVVDATIGNGNDILLLCELAKFVYGFDIQNQALETTTNLLKSHHLTNYKLILDSHEHILDYVKDFKAVVFNLGYLPNSDKRIKTTKETTLNAINKLIHNMKHNTFILITCYPGHDEGLIESEALLDYVGNLSNDFTTLKYNVLNKVRSPFIILIEKI